MISTIVENYVKALFFLEETATSVTVSAVAEIMQKSCFGFRHAQAAL